MPPFFSPVASIRSLSELPSYPRLLKIGAAASTIFRRVCSPLVITLPIFQSHETARSLPILSLLPYGCSQRLNGLTRTQQIDEIEKYATVRSRSESNLLGNDGTGPVSSL